MAHIYHMRNVKSQYSLLYVSTLRIAATLFIFIYHFMGLYGFDKRSGLDVIAISIFCFISGLLAYPPKAPAVDWIKKKYLQIMIPYWTVVTIVIIVNFIVGYKQKQIYELILLFFSGGMFIHKPLFVISWYVTFILCLYLMLLLCTYSKNIYVKFFFFAVSACLYIFVIKQPYIYAISFIVGCIIRGNNSIVHRKILKSSNSFIGNIMFFIQNRCYSFFLIHGGVLLFLLKLTPLSPFNAFAVSFLLTSLFSHIHYAISQKIFTNISNIVLKNNYES